MGNSRVIFVGAVSVIMGLYSVGLQRAERAVGRIGEVHSYQMQAEEIAKAGVALAINKLENKKPSQLPKLNNLSIFGGIVSYVVDDDGLPAEQARIKSTGTYKNHQAVRTAIVTLTGTTGGGKKKKKWSNWEVVRVFTQFSGSEFENQYTIQHRDNE
ncbi:MAG: hypothetical protein HYW57_01950 [Ignavibacteriales bacterium]|nr:hypothetical protein [Ignavibacteriales bacterium]